MNYQNKTKEELIIALQELQQENNSLKTDYQQKSSGQTHKIHYDMIVEKASDGFWLLDKEFKTVFVNPALGEMLGYTKEEMIGRSWYDFGDPAWVERAKELEKRRERGVKEPHEFLFIHKDGRKILTRIATTPLYDIDGNFDGAIGILSDITLQKAALRESENQFRNYVENAPIGVFICDEMGRYVQVNPAATTITGYTNEELLALNIPDLLPPESQEFAARLFQVVAETGKTSAEFAFRHKDGHIGMWFMEGIRLSPTRFMGLVTDITERRQADDLLQQTRNNYEAFFNTIDEFLFVLDEQGNIIHTNSTVIDRLGYTREELAGLSVLMVHPAEHRDEAARIVGEMLNGVSTFCPVPIVTKSGMQIPVETRVSHGVWDGKPAIFGVTKDISKVKLSEEKFSKLFHLNPSACGLSDLDTHQYIEVNEAFYALLGFDKNEVIGKTATDLGILTPETINTIMLKADSNGNVTNAEADLIAKNGNLKQVLISAENIQVQDKKYRFTVVHDITARRKIENQLKESEYLQRSLLENVAVGIMIIDPETRVIERINTFALSLIGESADNIIGRRCHQFLCPAHELNCPVCDKGQDVDNSERVLLRADNTAIPILKTVKRIQIGGKEKLLESFVDISIQKKAEENLLKSSQKFEAIISASPDGIGMVSLDGKIQLMSKKLATMYGYSIEEIAELLGKEIFGFIDLSNHKMLMGNMNKLLTGEKGNKVTEYLAVKKDNSRFYVDINSTVLHDSLGNPESILFVERDITERKLAEEALFKSEEKFRTVADNTYDWEYWEGKDKQIIYISPSCERISGYKTEEFLSDRSLLKKIIHPADAKLFDDHFEKTHSIEHMRDIEELDFRIIKKDGSVAHIGHLCRPVFDDNDNCLGRRISSRDITERKKAEEILRKSEDQIKQLLQTTDQGIYGIDLNGCCTFINTAALKILDYQIEDCIGKNMHDLIHHSYSNGLTYPVKDCPIFRAKLSGESCHLDSEVLWRKNGSSFPAEYSSYPIFENDQIHGAVVTFSDITERKQAEAEIKLKNEELYIANSEKDKFFSIIAHDMRSPFNAFLGFTRIMVEELNTMSLEEIRNIVFSMRKSATNLYSLLENLLEWSMMQRGVIAYNPVSIPLALKIKESIELIIGSVQKKEIEINYEIPDDLSAFADVHMVESLIRNLISNAVKFTPKKGKITVSANKMEGNFIEIAVRDTGIGMKKELMSNLFRLDEQTGRMGTEGEPSTGLGLIICKDFVEKHGGNIWVESEEGKGSSFYFTLPMNI